jgi:histidinol-phosphate aminotransferase
MSVCGDYKPRLHRYFKNKDNIMEKQKTDIEKMIRPCCAGFEPYIAGKPVETIKRELGLKKVVKLASNENPLGPSKKAIGAMKKALKNAFYYPDSNSFELKQAISKKYKITPENIMVGAGSDELIELIAKLFFTTEDEIIISDHAFIRYEMSGKLMNSKVVSVPMKNYKHDLEAMADAVTGNTKAIFIANPNNPTGTYNTKAEFESFLNRLLSYSFMCPPLVIMDEAYYEYARALKDYPETLKYFEKYPSLIILRTFSKVYALAGLRAGYGFAAKEVVDYIDRIRPPFNLNSLVQAAGAASLADPEQVKKGTVLVAKEKALLYKELKKLGISFIPSAANFILMEIRPLSGREAFEKLLRLGVIVRAMDEYKLSNFVRVSIGLPEENRMFIESVRKLLKG